MYIKRLVPILLFLLPISGLFFVFREIIFGSKIFSHIDVLLNFLPYFHAVSTDMGLVNQSILSGFPLYTSISTTWFNPVNKLLFHFFDAFDGFRFLDILYLTLAYVFTYSFCRRIKLSHPTSILTGLVYIFAGQVFLWSETILITFYYFLLPLILLLCDIGLSRRGLVGMFLAIVSGGLLGVGWLAGHVQFHIYVLTVVFLYILFRVYLERPIENSRHYWLYVTIFTGVVYLVSTVVGWPQIQAVLAFLPVTTRTGGVSLGYVFGYGYLPQHLLHYLLPSFSIPYPANPHAFQNYIGILPFLIAIIGWSSVKKLWNNQYYRFFLGVFIFCFVTSIKYSPIALLLNYLPVYSAFREATRIMFVGDFAWAIVIGYTIEYLWDARVELTKLLRIFLVWFKKIYTYVVLPVAVIFTGIVFYLPTITAKVDQYFLKTLYTSRVGGFPVEHYYTIIEQLLDKTVRQFSVFDSGMLLLLCVGPLSYLLLKKIHLFSRSDFINLAVLITTLNFVGLYGGHIHGITNDALTIPPQTVAVIKAQKDIEPYRIFSPLDSIALFNESVRCTYPILGNWEISEQEFLFRKELIEPNLNMLYGIDSADGYEPYMSKKMSDLLGYIGSRYAVGESMSLTGEHSSLQQKIDTVISRKNIYRQMNVRYIISHFSLKDDAFTEVFHEKFGACGSDIYIYRLSNTWPRYFLTNNVKVVSDSLAPHEIFKILGTLKEPTIVLQESSNASTHSASVNQSSFQQISASTTKDEIKFTVSGDKSKYAFVGYELLPGWHALIDGIEVPLLRANYVYMAVLVPSGTHQVIFRYNPQTVTVSQLMWSVIR